MKVRLFMIPKFVDWSSFSTMGAAASDQVLASLMLSWGCSAAIIQAIQGR